jgi:hypothetical protein
LVRESTASSELVTSCHTADAAKGKRLKRKNAPALETGAFLESSGCWQDVFLAE